MTGVQTCALPISYQRDSSTLLGGRRKTKIVMLNKCVPLTHSSQREVSPVSSSDPSEKSLVRGLTHSVRVGARISFSVATSVMLDSSHLNPRRQILRASALYVVAVPHGMLEVHIFHLCTRAPRTAVLGHMSRQQCKCLNQELVRAPVATMSLLATSPASFPTHTATRFGVTLEPDRKSVV